MDSILERQVRVLSYIGPRKAFVLCSMHETMVQRPGVPKAFQMWRTRKQKPLLFIRQAALFCFGRKCMAPDSEWAFAFCPMENSFVDVVFRQCTPSGEERFEMVQLKELVPAEVPSQKQTLQELLDKLPGKYPSAAGITIGIYLNREATTDLHSLRYPQLNGGSIWLFGPGGEPPYNSFLIGDLLSDSGTRCFFNYPRSLPGESPSMWRTMLDDEPLPL